MDFEWIDRPPRNRRKLGDEDLDWDTDLEQALIATLGSGRAIKVPLWMFHSSPAKGRLWSRGYKVAHRVLKDRRWVGAWLVPQPLPTEQLALPDFLK